MDNLILSSATVGIVISLLAYEIGLAAQRQIGNWLSFKSIVDFHHTCNCVSGSISCGL